jgi:AGCS family alanine or glycine:cation symporter
LGYLILSLTVLFLRHELVGAAFRLIFESAFRPESAVGGVGGFLISKSLRLGSMRGLLSNEGGCGTAPTAHAQADTDSAARQGVWGIFEVFVDTIVLCTATALVILVSLPQVELLGGNSVMMTVRAYSSVLGSWSELFLCGGILCFGYATLLCWASYGLEALEFLGGRRFLQNAYLVSFSLLTVIGAVATPSFVWVTSDVLIAAMTSINLCALLLMRREIKKETLSCFGKKQKL